MVECWVTRAHGRNVSSPALPVTLPVSPEQKAVDRQLCSCQLLHREWMNPLVQGLFVQTVWFCVAGDLAVCMVPISLEKWALLAEGSRMTQTPVEHVWLLWSCSLMWTLKFKAKQYRNGNQHPWLWVVSSRWLTVNTKQCIMVSNAELENMKLTMHQIHLPNCWFERLETNCHFCFNNASSLCLLFLRWVKLNFLNVFFLLKVKHSYLYAYLLINGLLDKESI